MADDIDLPNLISHLQVNLANTSGIVADASRQGSAVGAALGRSLQNRVRDAVDDIPDVQIDADSHQLDRDLARVRAELQELGEQRIGIDISVDEALRRMGELEPHLDRLSREHPNIDVTTSITQARANLAEIIQAAQRADDTDVDITVDVDGDRALRDSDLLQGSLSRLGGVGRTVAGAMGSLAGSMGMASAALGAAVPLAAGLATTLLNVAPAAGVAATGMIAMTTAQAAFKIGMIGVDEALSVAFDPEKVEEFNEAMEKLSPNARAFVTAIRKLKPAFDEIQLDVQDRLFRDLDTTLKGTVKAIGPDLGRALGLSADALNLMGQQVLNTATGLGKSGALGQALDSATRGMFNLSGLPAVLVQGLVQVGAAAGPAFERLTSAGGDALDRLSDRMAESFASGGMERAIEQAIALIRQLAEIGQNVGGILAGIFRAADAGGGGFLTTLQEITGALNEAFNSPDVQAALRQLFTTMGQLAATAGPLLIEVLRAVAPVLTQLGPPAQRLIEVLGDALTPIIRALSPVLEQVAQAVGVVVDAFAPFLPVISNLIVTALRPLTPIIQKIADVFVKLSPLIARLAELFGAALAPILEGLGEIVVQLVSQFADQFMAMLPELIATGMELAPVFLEIARSVGEILIAVAPLLPQLMMLSVMFISQLLPAITPLLGLFARVASAIAKMASWAIREIAIPAIEGLISFITGIRDKMQPFIDAAKWVTEKVAAAFEWLYNHLVGNSVIPDMIRGIGSWFSRLPSVIAKGLASFVAAVSRSASDAVRWFTGLPGRAAGALAPLAGRLRDRAVSAGRSLVSAIGQKVSEAIAAVRGLPGRAAAALGGLGGRLYSAGRSLVQGFINGIRGAFGSVRSTLSTLTSLLPDWKGPAERDATILTPAGRLLIDGLIRGIDRQAPALRARLAALTANLPAMTAPVFTPGVGPLAAAAMQTRGGDQINHINLYGSDATPDGIIRELSWRGLVERG